MCCATQNEIKSRQMQKKFIALALLICFIFLPLFSIIYIMNQACHEFSHYEADDCCRICDNISTAKELLKQIGAAVKSISFAFADLLLLGAALYAVAYFGGFQTLVNLKIRMNN